MAKTYTIIKTRRGKETVISGTLEYLVNDYFGYTLEVGKSWEHEKGNRKVNINPKTGAALVKSLNIAVDNAAANGYSGVSFELV